MSSPFTIQVTPTKLLQNRLLQMIRQQQIELQRLQTTNATLAQEGSSAISERSGHGTPQNASSMPTITPIGSHPRSPILPHHRGSTDHRRSRTPSRGASPRLRSTSISAESSDWALGGRDESAFYQAETQMLTRENQMLRHRIRDLGKTYYSAAFTLRNPQANRVDTEKQLADVSVSPSTASLPPLPSHLVRSTTLEEQENEPSTNPQQEA